MYLTAEELFESFSNHRPEGKLELVEGRLVVGNTIVGSRLLLRQVLQGWRADAAIALAPMNLWIEALQVGFNLPSSTEGDRFSVLQDLETACADVEYQPENLIPGEGVANYPYYPHHGVRQYLSTCLHDVAEDLGGQAFGRDFVMRLGENGFTPDLMFFKSKNLNQLYSWYLNGPAELVVEVLLSGHEYCDRIAKRDYYALSGVPECWIVAPQRQQIEFLRLLEGQYEPQVPDEDGWYRPSSVPGLAFHSSPLWNEENWYGGRAQPKLFVLETEPQSFQRIKVIESAQWGSLPFAPHLQLEPTLIQFDEYISWCPPAKFEFFDGKPQISYKRGTKRVLELLLMTFGLASAVKVLPPQAWVQALRQRVLSMQQDEQRKAEWWQLAQQAASVLREQFGIQRVGVIGDLVCPQPLNYWSEIQLVVWEMDRRSGLDIYKALSAVSEEPKIQLINVEKDYLTTEEKEVIEGAIAI
ncbi:Uma2 family endonuclease [Leptolyngbya sp. FACHB-671]|uniref:Uma2 family endonuclease n=1 Tax=Leptolyngbya sp. FACHB-671 TaxID=2692812 RepID=UPI001685B1B8|nr:Uma2 family endonuclease [Leptolyngbya sp. FACHB-671]MBD2068664.1 Uma2 family endonuclease [Leptolyngbya sp. FACHB-671]